MALTFPTPTPSIWFDPSTPDGLYVADQRHLPESLPIVKISSVAAATTAIRDMWVRGAPLIGITAAFGVWLAARESLAHKNPERFFQEAVARLEQARPTAVNLSWAIAQQRKVISDLPVHQWPGVLLDHAHQLMEEDRQQCKATGVYALEALQAQGSAGTAPQWMTHCNAGRLATVAYGTATAPFYLAKESGIDFHVWVSETRPRNQGFSITAYELAEAQIPHTLLVDNAAGLLMQQGKVDAVIVGADRVAANGDVVNKVGTYLKALAAYMHQIPFYVAVPTSSVDISMETGKDVPIEERAPEEVTHLPASGRSCRIAPEGSTVVNPAFDITPASYITALITEKGVVPASVAGIRQVMKKNP